MSSLVSEPSEGQATQCDKVIATPILSDPVRRKFFERKSVFDFVVGWSLLVLLSPLIVLSWLLVKLTSRGPGFYCQTRVQQGGRTFDVIKVRSMRVDAESNGKAVWCKKGDPRITPVGRFLRKTHLDELPQLFNVVRGEMSLVGPRPERPEICEQLAGQIPNYYSRVAVKPGITGLAQINLEPDQTLEDVKRKQYLDLHYIENTNLYLEIRILLSTALRLFGVRGDRAMQVSETGL